MEIPVRIRLTAILLILSAISFVPAVPSSVKIICGFLQTFYLPGFVFLIFLWGRQFPVLDDIFIPLAVSPIVLSLFVAATFMLIRSLETCTSISLLILYGLLLVALIRSNKFLAPESVEVFPRTIAFISLLVCGMVGALYLLNPYLLVRSDAFVHAPLVSEIIDHGIPPLEPRLPDTLVRYPWFYHLFLASFIRLTAVSVFRALGLLNVVNALVFPYLIARITAHFSRKRTHILSAPIFAVAGLTSASWILWPVALLRTLAGEVKGQEEIARILSESKLNDFRVIYFLTPHWTLMVNTMDKLLTITPFTCAINLFLLCFLLVLSRDFQRRAPFKAALDIAFITVGTFLIHVVTGIVLIFTLVGAGIVMSLGQLLRKRERFGRFQTFAIPALALLAGIICLPYFRSLTGGGGEKIVVAHYLHIGTRNIITILAPMVGLFFIIKPLLKYMFRTENTELKILLAWLIALFVVNACINLYGENPMKFVALLFVLLIVPVSIVLIDWIGASKGFRRAAAVVWIAILFFVPPLLTARGFLLDKPDTDALRIAYMPGSNRMQLYDWIRTNTGSTSVIIELNTQNYTPLYAHRHTFIPFGELTTLLGYTGEQIEQYKSIHQEIFSARPLPGATIEYLRNLGHDLYIILWAEDVQANPYLDEKFRSLEPRLKNVYENPSGKIYQLDRASAYQ